MRILLGVAAAIFFASGLVVYRAAWLCRVRTERAGWWHDPRAGLAAFVFLATMSAPVLIWAQRAASVGGRMLAWRLGVFVVTLMLYLPFLAYHAGAFLGGMLGGQSPLPPEPKDPLARAKAAEASGDVRGAIERYVTLLEDEPAHIEARTRFAQLLARTARISQAKEVIARGLAREDVHSDAKAGWEALLRDWKEGRFVEPPPGPVRREDLGIHRIAAPRIESDEPGDEA